MKQLTLASNDLGSARHIQETATASRFQAFRPSRFGSE